MNLHSTTRGILWMVASCFISAILVSSVRQASLTQHPFEVVFFRNLFALFFFLPWLMRKGLMKNIASLRTGQLRWHFARAFCGIAGMLTWFYAISIVPLPVAVSLSFTAPLFTALLAIMLFKERYGIHRWAAMIIGFLGVLVIMRPGTEAFNPAALLVIISTVFWAASGMIIKRLTRKDDPTLVAFYLTLLVTPLSLPAALAVWQPLTPEDVLILMLVGLMACLFQVFLSRAIAATEFAVILPFDYTRLIFICIFAYVFFGEVIDGWTLAGSLMIMAGAAYTAMRNRKYHLQELTAIKPEKLQ